MPRKNPPTETLLLKAILRHVPQHGWTDDALRAAARGKITLADLMGAFPNGVSDALTAFTDFAQDEMLLRLSKQKLIQMRVRDRVATAVWEWLTVMAPHRDAVAAAVRSSWNPAHAWLGARALAKLCNAIWTEAGDTATDYNRYTKRGLLAAVFTATLLFWLADRSENYENTRAFLSARIDNALALGKAGGQLKNLGGMLKQFRRVA